MFCRIFQFCLKYQSVCYFECFVWIWWEFDFYALSLWRIFGIYLEFSLWNVLECIFLQCYFNVELSGHRLIYFLAHISDNIFCGNVFHFLRGWIDYFSIFRWYLSVWYLISNFAKILCALACELVVYSGVIFLKSFIILCWMNVHQYFVETFCLRKGLDEYFGAPINCSLFFILCFPYWLLVCRLNVRLFRLSLLFTPFLSGVWNEAVQFTFWCFVWLSLLVCSL